MLNERTLKALNTALLCHRNVNSQLDNWPPENKRPFEDAQSVVTALLDGDTIASLWSIEDVFAVMFPDEDGTRGHTDDEIAEAREVLELADREHDATVGINWGVLEAHLDYVREQAA